MGGNEQEGGRREPRFGGDWTEQKLSVLEAYLRAYTTALKDQSFKKAYIDAFAGTGYRDISDSEGLGASEEAALSGIGWAGTTAVVGRVGTKGPSNGATL